MYRWLWFGGNEVWSSKYLKQYYIWGKGKSTGDHKQDVVFSFYSSFKLGFLLGTKGDEALLQA